MEVFVDGGVPVKSWSVGLEDQAREQIVNLSRLPFAKHHVALMPDGHAGYGMPIGGALFAEKAIVPYAIGVDIGCGVSLIETDLTYDGLPPDRQGAIKTLMQQIARDVPVGMGGNHKHPQGEPFTHKLIPEDPDYCTFIKGILAGADLQLGTLGSGNHFLELQADEEGRLWFMLHSGSRSVGYKICEHWHKVALGLNEKWYSKLPHKELAYLPWDTEEARGYWADMTVAMAWAEENRRRMAGKVISAIGRILGGSAWQVLDVHHNYAAWENHFGVNGIVHRKGAVRANAGEMVLIPGSMSTGSYVAEGLGNPESFNTCQHGAGRARSRKATAKMITVEEMDRGLDEQGIVLVTPDRAGVTDEAGIAYKDIESVMAASADLIKPIRRHRPLGVVKG